MDFGEFFSNILPVVFVVVGVALVWLLIELVVTVRKTRTAVDDVQKKLDPTLESIEKITASLEPAVAKIDPLVERVALTVDAANLEIMRLDQILEDVNDITDKVSTAANAVESATSAPIAIVNTMTDRVRGVLRSRRASDESIALGEKKAEHAFGKKTPNNPAAALVSEGIDTAEQLVAETFASEQPQRDQRAADTLQREETLQTQNEAAANVARVAQAHAAEDAQQLKEKYFTYEETSTVPIPDQVTLSKSAADESTQ